MQENQTNENNAKLIKRINELKKEKKAVILVHNYQRPEIYEVADYIGDSLDLSKRGVESDAEIILFCGVNFMAESAKILNPEKKVLLPVLSAKCPMAAMATAEELKKKKEAHPNAKVVCYINTSAEVKAECDICCTSMNAQKIIESLEEDEIIFAPDFHLATYIQTKTDKKIIPWGGYCYVHSAVIPDVIKEAKEKHPKAKVVVHPECPLEVIELGDEVCGTGGMITYAKENPAKEFIIVTEEGMVERLRRDVPEKKFYSAAGVCFNQKFITLKDVLSALENEQHEVNVPEEIRLKAKKALDKMLEI